MDKRLRIWETALLLALCIALCAGTWAQGGQEAISSSLVRLHVIADDDSEPEQALKLRVRDAVLAYLAPRLEGAESSTDARNVIERELPNIRTEAEKLSGGRKISVTLGMEYYPTRRYGSFSLPAGRYESLRVIIGSGRGHNWWCVVFPPLCVSAAERESALDAMSEPERGIIASGDGYELRFRILELWGEIVGKQQNAGFAAPPSNK